MLKPALEPTLSPKNLKTFSFWTIIYIESEREIRAIRAYNPYYFPKTKMFLALLSVHIQTHAMNPLSPTFQTTKKFFKRKNCK